MHTVKLNIDDSIYTQFLSFINQFQSNEVSIIENNVKEDFIVTSAHDVRERILKAELNANYISEDMFWDNIDNKIKTF